MEPAFPVTIPLDTLVIGGLMGTHNGAALLVAYRLFRSINARVKIRQGEERENLCRERRLLVSPS